MEPILRGMVSATRVFERDTNKLRMELLQTVPLADSVKLSRLRLTNNSPIARTLAVTFYAEWVLGPNRGRFCAIFDDSD